MSFEIIPFKPRTAVAKKTAGSLASALLANSPAGFPVVSIKGKVFHLVRDGERQLVTKPGDEEGSPASSLEVIIVNANPHRSRVFYRAGYEEGNADKPDCYSNDGTAPAADAKDPQSSKCAVCAHSQFGSKTSESGQKGFACANSQRLAIVPVGDVDDPMLLRVPGASLKALTSYVKDVVRAGYDLPEVVTRVGFDYTVAHPALTFKAAGVLPPDVYARVTELSKTETVGQIIGTVAMPEYDTPVEDTSAPDTVAKLPKREPKPKAKPAPVVAEADELDAIVDAAATKPKAKVNVESVDEPVEAPAKAKKPAVEAMGDEIDSMLDGADWDD